MTVKDLINRLSQCDPETPVTLEFTDTSDYLYFFNFGDSGVEIVEQDEGIIGVTGDDPFDPGVVEGKSVTIKLDEGKAFYGLGLGSV